jgi:hypothetical protein
VSTTLTPPQPEQTAVPRRRRIKKIILIAFTLVALVGAAAGGYIVKHNADVARHKADVAQHKAEVAHAQAVKREQAYQAKLEDWKSEMSVWTEQNEQYKATKAAMEPAYAATDKVTAMITTGGYNREDLTDAVQEASAALSAAIRQIDSLEGLNVTRNVEKAIDQWSDAANIWLEWQNDLEDSRELEDLPLDGHFAKADNRLWASENALDEMKPGAQPVKPVRPTAPRAA